MKTITHVAGCSSLNAAGKPHFQPATSNQQPATPSSPGFTLIELLVVIGIIALLISILLPVVGRMHRIAYETSTRSEIEQIANACHNYYNDFRAYPGPLSNSDIETRTVGGTLFDQPNVSLSSTSIVISSTNTSLGAGKCLNGVGITGTAGVTMLFSGSENLVLGILGGLEISPNYPGQIIFLNAPLVPAPVANAPNPATLVGQGPRSLVATSGNPYGNKQYTAYMPVSFPGSPFLLNGDGTQQTVWDGVNPPNPVPAYHDAGGRTFLNSIVPVFTDQYPDAMPILYLRARVGAHGIISGPGSWAATSATAVTDPTITGTPTAHYNYDLYDIVPFTYPNSKYLNPNASVPPGLLTGTGPGAPDSGGIKYANASGQLTAGSGQHGLQSVGNGAANTPPLPYNYTGTLQGTANAPVPTNTVNNAGEYFMNLSIPATNFTTAPAQDYTNATGTPRAKDEFILISAGTDRTYGSSDDITSFGDVQP